MPVGLRLAAPPDQQIALAVQRGSGTLLQVQVLQIGPCHGDEFIGPPGVHGHHQVAGKALDQAAGASVVETFLTEGGRQRTQTGIARRHGHHADGGAEHEPVRRLSISCIRWPGHTTATDQAAIDTNRIGPVDGYRPFGRSIDQQRVTQGDHAGVEGPSRTRQRFLGLEHDCKFGQIEAADMHQRPGALFGGNSLGMLERVTHFPQRHQAEGRREVQRRRGGGAGTALHFAVPDPRRLALLV